MAFRIQSPQVGRWFARTRATIVAMVASGTIVAAAQPMSEHTVKVGLIFNFGKFVEWPASTIEGSEKFRICYLGTPGALHRELARLDGKSLQSKPVEVLRITGSAEIRNCLMLVLGEAEARDPKRELLCIAGENSILTIGDAEGFAAMALNSPPSRANVLRRRRRRAN